MRLRLGLLFILGLPAGACNNNPAGPGDGGSGDMAMDPGTDGFVPPGDLSLPVGTTSMRLISSTYSIPAGQEPYQCQRITMTKDIYIVRITPVSPQGVHHEVLALDNGSKPDGVELCGAGAVAQAKTLFASGINSPSLGMPDKVALKVAAGEQILLNLHLFNTTPNALNNTAAIDVVIVNDPTGYELAGVPFAGRSPLPPWTIGADLTITGSCTVSNDTKFFAVFPHAHQTGKHIKIVAGSTVVWDRDYDFMDQKFGFAPVWDTPQVEIALKKGDKITVTCNYTQAGQGRTFGDSSDKEMCFGISYVHPAIQTTFGTAFCAN